ncbi:hypothetical protein [uncultured Sulfitobacter sp.]|uniref:hypothetical protein n=1 Tax=uncultured Sulfitobacter sp. TaxID=191468 RepID=UPI002629C46C|nr:hypothetical protein [uncultured Sulfitobacter sp.]
MADKTPPQTPAQKAKAEQAARREARLKQALKANMTRRKMQARARAGADTPTGNARDAQDKEH